MDVAATAETGSKTPRAVAPGGVAAGGPRHGLALPVLAAAQLMVVLDATIVNVALPHIQRALGFSGSGLEWVVNAYALTFGGLLLLGGRTGDRLGRRKMFIAGLLLFSAASLAGGFADSQACEVANPPARDANENSRTPKMKTRRRPSRSPARPPSSNSPPKASV